MFKTNVNQKSVFHIRDGIESLKLPDYIGTAVLNRITDDNGQVILTNGKLTTIEPYLFVKSAPLTSIQQQSVIDVVTNVPSEKTVRDAEEKAWSDARPAREMEMIRNHRNGLLAETDWMALGDVTISDAWKTYRQELRDVPASNLSLIHI